MESNIEKIQRELYPSLQRTYTKRTLIKTNFERSDHWNSSKLGDNKTKGFLAIGGTLLYRLQDQTSNLLSTISSSEIKNQPTNILVLH